MTFNSNKVNIVKSTLAKLLAMENISIRHIMGLATASFDLNSRILRLPTWQNISEDLYDMLVVHEVGHALETPYNDWVTKIGELAKKYNPIPGDKKALNKTHISIQGYANILEDIRVDIKQRNRFPGAKRNYVIGYKELFDRNFFKTNENPIEKMTFINRLNIYSKSGFSGVIVPFYNDEKILVKKSQETDTFEDVLALAEELWLLQIRSDDNAGDVGGSQTQAEENELIETGESIPSEDYDDSGDETEKPNENDEKNEPLIPPEAQGPTTKEQDEKNKELDKKFSQPQGGGARGSNIDIDNLPETETDDAFNENVNSLSSKDGISYYYSHIPILIGEPWYDYKLFLAEHKAWQKDQANQHHGLNMIPYINILNKFKNDENQTISFMVKEFEMRKSASAYMKSLISKTGVINTNKIYSYHYNDDIFKRNVVTPTGKNHGFVMFLDWSSSMQINLVNTVKQLFSLALFCRRISVPFEVYTFTTKNGTEHAYHEKGAVFEKTPESLKMDLSAYIRNVLSSRMNANEFQDAMIILLAMALTYGGSNNTAITHHYNPKIDVMSGTPLNETILVSEAIIKKFQKQTGVQITNVIFLTDGDGVSPSLGMNDYNIKTDEYCILIQDPKTREEYALPSVKKYSSGYQSQGYYSQRNNPYDWTNMFLRMLKQRTGCNLIGFYLDTSYSSGGVGRNWQNVIYQGRAGSIMHSDYINDKKFWKENGYITIKNSGYDEYYYISSPAFKLDNSGFEIRHLKNPGTKLTSTKISKMFTDFMQKKTTNRILLNSFIKKIT